MSRFNHPSFRRLRAFAVLLLVLALGAAPALSEEAASRDRVKVRLFVVRDGQLAMTGYAGLGETITVSSREDGEICTEQTRGRTGWWRCRPELKVQGSLFVVRSTGGGLAVKRVEPRASVHGLTPPVDVTPLGRRIRADKVRIGHTRVRRGKLSIRGSAGRGNTVTVMAQDGSVLCQVVARSSGHWSCSVRGVAPGTFTVDSSGGGRASITR